MTQKSTQPVTDALVATAPGTTATAYVPGAHASAIRSRNAREQTALLARRDVVDAAKREAEDELADIATALQLLSEPVTESNVTAIRAAS